VVVFLGIVNFSFERVNGWIGNERQFAGYCLVDGIGGHCRFLGEDTGDDRNSPTVKEVKQSVVDRPRPNSQLIDIVPQIVRLRSSKFMTKKRQASNGRAAFVVDFGIARIDFFQPVKDRRIFWLCLVDDDVDGWH
jgi:hypothetical protein